MAQMLQSGANVAIAENVIANGQNCCKCCKMMQMFQMLQMLQMLKNVVENVARGCKMMQMLQNDANVEKCCKC